MSVSPADYGPDYGTDEWGRGPMLAYWQDVQGLTPRAPVRPLWAPCLSLSVYGDHGPALDRADVAAEVSKQLAPVRKVFTDLNTAVRSVTADVRDLKGLADWLEAREIERSEEQLAEVD
jgi:hypothetical protein